MDKKILIKIDDLYINVNSIYYIEKEEYSYGNEYVIIFSNEVNCEINEEKFEKLKKYFKIIDIDEEEFLTKEDVNIK